MSMLNVVDATELIDGYMNRLIAQRRLFDNVFKEGVLSVLIVDPDNLLSINQYTKENPDLGVKYVDFSKCEEEDSELIERQIKQGGYKGFLFDNIDEVGWVKNKVELEYLIKNSLKRANLPMDLDDIMIGCRCKEIPEYLKGKSMQMVIIEV